MTPFRVYDFNQCGGNLVFFFLVWRKYKDPERTNFWTLGKFSRSVRTKMKLNVRCCSESRSVWLKEHHDLGGTLLLSHVI